MRNKFILTILAIFYLGCTSYSGGTLHILSEKNLAATSITVEMCDDFRAGSKAAAEGDDRAWSFLGIAMELSKLSVGLDKHGLECDETVERINRPGNPMAQDIQDAILEDFQRSWLNVEEIIGDE